MLRLPIIALIVLSVFTWIAWQPEAARADSSIISSLSTGQPVVALTFDDGPTPYEPDILDTLQKNKIQAAFFWIGQGANANQAKQVLQAGSSIQNHSMTHPLFQGWSYNTILTNLDSAQSAIQEASGTTPVYFRPPYGYTNSNLLGAAAAEGLKVVTWNVDSRDWANPNNPDAIKQNVYSEVTNGSIILFHEKAITAKILPDIINHLKDQGYSFTLLPGLKPPAQKVPLQVHGQLLNVQGVLQNDLTMAPVRAVFEALGARVTWHDDQSIDLSANNRIVHFHLNDPNYTLTYLSGGGSTSPQTTVTSSVYGSTTVASSVYGSVSFAVHGTMPASAYLIQDTTFAPLRVLAEALGFTVGWDQNQARID
ncbi:MAG: pgdA 3 [Bacilli bacterium]|nr:pgdA 3 [Bacilli bacterium]